VGGTSAFAEAITQADQLFLNHKQVNLANRVTCSMIA
jgi:hypothetical protein